MTRSLDSTLAAALDEEVIEGGFLVAITKPDGTVVRSSTLGVFSATYGGDEYVGSIGFDFSSMTLSSGDSQPAIDGFTAAGSTAPFTFDEAVSGYLSGCSVRVFLYHYGNGKGHELGSKWYIGKIQTDQNGKLSLEIKSSGRRNRQVFLKTYGPGCRWSLGSAPNGRKPKIHSGR